MRRYRLDIAPHGIAGIHIADGVAADSDLLPVRQLGVPVKLSRTPGDANRLPGPALGEHTEEVLRSIGLSDEEIAGLLEQGAVAGPASGVSGSFMAR